MINNENVYEETNSINNVNDIDDEETTSIHINKKFNKKRNKKRIISNFQNNISLIVI